MRFLAITFLLGNLLTLTSSVLADRESDHTDAALRQLHRATTSQKDGQHLLSLSALRSLRDPDLRPFFHQFSQHSDWAVQVHAVLGLAELSNEKTVDPWLIQQISPPARQHVVSQGLDDGLFQKEQIETLLNWPYLESSPRLLLLADLLMLEGTTNLKMLKELSSNTDLSVAMFAALLSEDQGVIERTTQNLRRATRPDRGTALLRTLLLIRKYKLVSSTNWLQVLLEKNAIAITEQERYWALFTLLTVDQNAGLQAWETAFSTDPDRKDQVRYLLLLLEAGIVPAETQVARLKIELDDNLLGTMVRAGNINKPQNDITLDDTEQLANLVKQGHRASTDWAFRVSKKKLKGENANIFYTEIASIPKQSNPRRNNSAIQAFIRLIETDQDAAWKLLQKTEDDSEQQQLLLLAMLQLPDEEISKQAVKIRRIGLNKADIMTLLLVARGAAALPENDQDYLGIIAAGGGHLSPGLETQAAWLYLKRIGLADKALAAVSPK